jgi:hypothetical protein
MVRLGVRLQLYCPVSKLSARFEIVSGWHSLTENLEELKMSIWMILFVVLLIAWVGGFTMFHVAGGLIHLLLLFAVISIVLHFVMGRRAA